MEEVIQSLDQEKPDTEVSSEPEVDEFQVTAEAQPVIKLVNMMIIEAVHQGASNAPFHLSQQSWSRATDRDW